MTEEHSTHETHHENHGAHHGHHAAWTQIFKSPEMKLPKIDMKDLNIKKALDQFIAVLKFDKKAIEEVAHDEKFGAGAAFFLLAGAVVGPLLSWIVGIRVLGVTVRPDFGPILASIIFSVVVAVLLMFLTTLIAVNLFKGHGTFAQYFRVMGLVYGLNVLNVIGVLFFSLSVLMSLVVGLWMVALVFTIIKVVSKLDDTNTILTLILMVVGAFVLMAVVGALGFAGATYNLSGV